jgi:fatty acid desaturase
MIFEQASNQIRSLVNQEVASAKAEVSARAKLNAVGIGLIAGAVTLVLLALAALTTAAIAALATTFSIWLSALIVAGVYLLVAIALGVIGKGRMKKGGPPLPTDTMHGLKEDVRKARANGKTTEMV